MKRIGTMAAVALFALLLALPVGAAMAQGDAPSGGNTPPATLYGTVMADGLPVPMGTMITAMVGDEKVGSTMVMEGGKFGPLQLMAPSGDDMMVMFMVGDRMVTQSYEWMSGGLDMQDLTADLGGNMEMGAMGPAGPAGSAGVPGPKGDPGAAGAMGSDGAQGPPGAQGPAGEPGAAGAAGADGPQGPQGTVGGAGTAGSMGIIALIVAIVAAIIGVVAIIMGRRQTA
jgi:hypothetical protein